MSKKNKIQNHVIRKTLGLQYSVLHDIKHRINFVLDTSKE
jgi:hypothetical protein